MPSLLSGFKQVKLEEQTGQEWSAHRVAFIIGTFFKMLLFLKNKVDLSWSQHKNYLDITPSFYCF